MSLAFSFALFALVGVERIAASRFRVSRKVAVLTNKVVGEGRKIAREYVVIVELPSFDEGVELRPALDGFLERLNFCDVRYLLVETSEGLIMVDVVGNVSRKSSKLLRGRLRSVSTVVMSCRVGVLYNLWMTSTSCSEDSDAIPATF